MVGPHWSLIIRGSIFSAAIIVVTTTRAKYVAPGAVWIEVKKPNRVLSDLDHGLGASYGLSFLQGLFPDRHGSRFAPFACDAA